MFTTIKKGHIIKVTFTNGDSIQGVYAGDRFAKRTYYGLELKEDHQLVAMNPAKKSPYVLFLNKYTRERRTDLKEVTRSRFPKEVSSLLKEYAKELDRYNSLGLEMLELAEQRKAEQNKMNDLEEKAKELNYKVNLNDLPLESRVEVIFKDFQAKLKGVKNFNQVDMPYFLQRRTGNDLKFLVTFKNMMNLPDEEVGFYPEFEYDGSYHPVAYDDFDVTKTVSRYLSISERHLDELASALNNLKGVTLSHDKLFEADPGAYSHKGSVTFEPRLELERDVSVETLEEVQRLIVNFLKKT